MNNTKENEISAVSDKDPIKSNFWSDLFFDIDECNQTKKEAAIQGGNEIKHDLKRIRESIENHQPKEAMEMIDNAIKYYREPLKNELNGGNA